MIKEVIPATSLDENTIYHLNPSGASSSVARTATLARPAARSSSTRTVAGAPTAVARSLARTTKVDRSAAYAARWVAKCIVAQKLAKRCLIQLSYAIGVAAPLSINIDSYGTSQYSDEQLVKIINANFDLRPGCIMRDLNLTDPVYLYVATSAAPTCPSSGRR